jgi:AraC family transcriptional regulator
MPADAIRKMGVGLPYATSCGFNWSGVEVHRYRLAAGETREHEYPQLSVFMSHTSVPVNGELFLAGERIPAKLGPSTVTIAPAGVPMRSRRDRGFEVTSIFLDPLAVTEIARAETGCDIPEVRMQYGIADPLIRSIGMMLDAELFSGCRSSRIYAESLATALAAQIFARYSNRASENHPSAKLNKTQLRRSVEFIHENLDKDLTLAEVAAVANMSKYHFAKSFRQMTGIAPHRYLVKVRIEKARKLLTLDTISVEEVANRVGYADKGHFSAQFMKIVGVSPSRYRLEI